MIPNDIKNYNDFVKITPINKGASSDKKYRVESKNGESLILRVSDIKEFVRKKAEYEMMERAYKFGARVPAPIDFGICGGGKNVYSLSEWLDGGDLETLMPQMSQNERYNVGLKAGALLRKIHELPTPENAEPWSARFREKALTRIDLYEKHKLHSENGEIIIKYLRENRNFADGRPQTFWHGDFNAGNLILMPNGEIAAIDFNYWNLDYGDPWWDFIAVPWGKEILPHYFTGLINGYFSGNPPPEFFETLSYYFACDALSAVCYTFLGEENETPEEGKRHMENILRWFDGMQNTIPSWYIKIPQ